MTVFVETYLLVSVKHLASAKFLELSLKISQQQDLRLSHMRVSVVERKNQTVKIINYIINLTYYLTQIMQTITKINICLQKVYTLYRSSSQGTTRNKIK